MSNIKVIDWVALKKAKDAEKNQKIASRLTRKNVISSEASVHLNVIKFRELIESKKELRPYNRIYERFVKKRKDGWASIQESLLRDLFDVLEVHWTDLIT